MEHQENQKGPLAGVRVVEYAVFHAGPGAASILGELGADVVKVESGIADPSRGWTSVGSMDFALPGNQSVAFQVSNRNKRGLFVQLKTEQGRKIFDHLIAGADVFITNLRKTSLSERKLDYAPLRQINAKLIYAAVSGYGPNGPDSDLGAYDPLGQARSGLMYAAGQQEPCVLNLALLDQVAAIATSHAILTALFVREREGVGQQVDVSLLSSALWMMYPNMYFAGTSGKDPNMAWNRLDNSPLRNRFRCKDGRWIMSTHHPEDKYWPAFCEATGQGRLLSDARFIDEQGRKAHCQELVALFDDVFAQKSCDEWMRIFLDAGLMFSPVQRNLDVLSDPQVDANDYMVDFDHPVYGKVKIPGYPFHFSENSAGVRTIGIKIGEHTDQILTELGYSQEKIDRLKARGVVR
ncbi:MAG: CoA transferase [Desulfatitalea sp.]|nr:CoA transferase [Desulfatitalea sp.]NNK02551.1 CoA transferase [Desulfatitalea sp.]